MKTYVAKFYDADGNSPAGTDGTRFYRLKTVKGVYRNVKRFKMANPSNLRECRIFSAQDTNEKNPLLSFNLL